MMRRTNLDKDNAYKIVSVLDRQTKTVRWWYPVAGGSGTLTAWLSYHWPSGKWGYGESTIEAALEYATPAMDYTALAARYSTYSDLPETSYDSVLFLGGTESPAVFNSSHVLSTISGTSTTAMIMTGAFGMDGQISLLTRLRGRYLDNPTSATLTNYYTDQLGSTGRKMLLLLKAEASSICCVLQGGTRLNLKLLEDSRLPALMLQPS